jgi:hypothetical protein
VAGDAGLVDSGSRYLRRPTLALAVAPEAIRWRSRPGLRAIVSLPMTASAASAQNAQDLSRTERRVG